MFSQVIAVALCVLVAQPAMAKCSRSYTVQAGDYCDKISAAQHVSTYQLAVNNIKKINQGCTNLVPGESLCLGTAGKDCTTTYVVAAGDTCDKIASVAGVNTTILSVNNPQINAECTDIYPGEVLCTANTAMAPSVPSGVKSVPIPSSSASASTLSPSASASSGNDAISSGSGGNGDENLPYCDEL